MSDIGSYEISTALPPVMSPADAVNKDRILAELLRRCSGETLAAARRFQQTHNPMEVPAIVQGVISRYVEADKRDLLSGGGEELRLQEDLELDSLSLIEMTMTLEEVLEITLNDEKLRQLRTVGDINRHTLRCSAT